MNQSKAIPPARPAATPIVICSRKSTAIAPTAMPLTPPAASRPPIKAIPTGSFAPDSPSRIVPLRPAISCCPNTENTTAGSVGETAVPTRSATYQASPNPMCNKTPPAAAVRKVPRTPTTMIGTSAGRSRDHPMCRPPLKRIRMRAIETTRSTTSSRGIGTPGIIWTATAAAASIQTGAGILSRTDNRFTKTAASAIAPVKAMINAYWAVSDKCCSSAGSTSGGDCRPAFPAHRCTHYARARCRGVSGQRPAVPSSMEPKRAVAGLCSAALPGTDDDQDSNDRPAAGISPPADRRGPCRWVVTARRPLPPSGH